MARSDVEYSLSLQLFRCHNQMKYGFSGTELRGQALQRRLSVGAGRELIPCKVIYNPRRALLSAGNKTQVFQRSPGLLERTARLETA